MPTPKITVLMPVFNGEAYLREAVESVLSQDYSDFELLAVDDGSKDGSASILESYADPRLRILRNPKNLGIVGAMQAGLNAASGKFVARMDADDVCLPSRLRLQLEYMESHLQTQLLGTACELIDSNGRVCGQYAGPPDPLLVDWEMLFRNPLVHSTVMFRRETVVKLGGYRDVVPYAEDYDLWSRIAASPRSVAVLPESLLRLRKHESQVSVVYRERMAKSANAVSLNAIRNAIGETPPAEAVFLLQGWVKGITCDQRQFAAAYAILHACLEKFLRERINATSERKPLALAFANCVRSLSRLEPQRAFQRTAWLFREIASVSPKYLFVPCFLRLFARLPLLSLAWLFGRLKTKSSE